MTRRIVLLITIGSLVLIAPVASQAAKSGPGTSAVTIAVAPNPISYGKSVTISGKLTAKTVAGVSVTLEASPYPYTHFSPVATAMTSTQGVYQFTQSPPLNTEYRVKAKSKPQATSTTVLVQVRTLVTVHVSTTTPPIGTQVRFSGLVTPAHDGQAVEIQRRSSTGTFITVATATLLHTTTGASSAYSKSLTIQANGTYRVVKPSDADHAAGFSSLVQLTVHPWVTIAATPNPVLFGHSVSISGKLMAKTASGVLVTLYAAPYPFRSFKPVRTARTSTKGVYHFSQSPGRNTKYRVKAGSTPPAASQTLLVQVRTLVTLHVSTTTPAIGSQVTFSGLVKPAHDGQLVLIQRRSPTGTFVTVASATLLHTATGASRYHKTLRILASGAYRVIKPHDADHATGISGLRTITVH